MQINKTNLTTIKPTMKTIRITTVQIIPAMIPIVAADGVGSLTATTQIQQF